MADINLTLTQTVTLAETRGLDGIPNVNKTQAITVAESRTVSRQEATPVAIVSSDVVTLADTIAIAPLALALHTYQTLDVADVYGALHGPIQYTGDDSLGVKYHETKFHPHTSKWYLAVKTPRIVWKGRVVGNRGAAYEGDIMDDFVIEASGGANEAGFDVTNFLPDVTVWIGTSDGGTEHGRCRIRHFNDATHLHVSADGSCVWRATDYISITDLHEYWPRPPHVHEDSDTWKDEDIPDSDRHEHPVPVMGPPACAFIDVVTGKATVQFDGGMSYVVQPNSLEYDDPALNWDNQGITGWAWWFEGADVTAASTRSATALYSTPGQYVVRLTVTGQGGYTEKGFRNVFIFDRSANPPVTQFAINRLSGSLGNRGWEAELEVFGDNFNKANMPNGAQAVLFAEEWYAGTLKASDYGIKADTYRSNIKMVGWLVQTRMTYSAKKVRNAQVTLRGLQEYIKSYSNFPVYFTQVENKAPGWSWFNASDGDALTVRKALYHLVKWHWTVLNFADFLIPDDHNNYVPGQNFSEGSLASQMESFTKDIQADWCCDCAGSLIVFSKPNWLAHSGRGSRWRARYYRDNILNADDFTELEVEPRITDETAKVRVEGLTGHADNTGFDCYVDSVPGDSRGYAGETFVLSNQVIGTGGAETGGPYGEMTQGYELARMVYAELTRPVERILMTMAGNYSQFDIVPQASYFKLTVTPEQTFRDLSWSQKPFWATDIEYEVDTEHGDVGAIISAIPETWMDEGVAAYAMYDDLAREKGEKMPKGGSGSFGSYSKSVDTPDVRVVPALMGNGGGLIDCFQTGKVFVRLYGDAAYCVLAECRGIKPVNDRPVDVQIVQRYDNQGRPAQIVYSVIAVRTSGYGGDTDQDRGYITRVPTFVIEGSAVVKLTDQCTPLKVVDARIFARRIHVLAIGAPVGGSAIFTVNLNLGSLGVATLGAGATEAVTTLTETLMEDGDELHLFVSGTATTMPSQVMIEVECREYGL